MDALPETLTPTGPQLGAGSVIAQKYRLDELLGAGSQGLVWKAHNLDLDLPVAIKLMHPPAEPGLALVPDRLFREARAAATLGHPGIVRIFDLGRTNEGLPYLTMELLRGESLARHLKQVGKLSPELAVRLALPVADALAAAHAQGIVHRDVKPDNILLSLCGDVMQPKLLDFGIARVADGQNLTQSGCVVGTPNYLPPEQARGLDDVDQRADIWALCATLYECVTGVVPFQASTWIDVLRRIVDDEPEPIATHGIDDPELWAIIYKGLSKDPDDRWSNMQEFARAASRWLLARGVLCDICGVSVESRWLRGESESGLPSGTTDDAGTWWAHKPPASAPRRNGTRRRQYILGSSAALLCLAAIAGVIRLGASESTASDGTAASTASEATLALSPASPPLPAPAAMAVEPAAFASQVNAETDTDEFDRDELKRDELDDDKLETFPPLPSAGEPEVDADATLAKTRSLKSLRETAPRKGQPVARPTAPRKPAAAQAADTIDLMDPY